MQENLRISIIEDDSQILLFVICYGILFGIIGLFVVKCITVFHLRVIN